MSTLETEAVELPASTDCSSNDPPRPRKPVLGASLLALLAVAGIAAVIYTYAVGLEHVRKDVSRAVGSVRNSFSDATPHSNTKQLTERRPWDGLVRITPEDAKSMGLVVAKVQPQTDPIKLELPGRTVL